MAYSSSFFDPKHFVVDKSVPGFIYFLTPKHSRQHAEHLMSVSKKHYDMKEDWDEELY